MTKSLLKLLIEGEKWDIIGSHYNFTPHFITFREQRYFNYRSAPAEMMRCLLDRRQPGFKKEKPNAEKTVLPSKPHKEVLFDRQNGHCFYCGLKRTIGQMTKEHKVPRSKGGRGGNNLVLACHPCNNAKGAKSIDDFVQSQFLKNRIRQVTGNNAKLPVNEI